MRSCWVVLLLPACQRESVCEATLAEIGTVIEVRAPGLEQVAFGPTEALGTVAPAGSADGDPDAALLLGLPPLTDVHWRGELDGRGRCEGVTRTGGLAAGITDVTITTHDAERVAPHRWFLTSVMGTRPTFLVFDRDGGRLWSRPQEMERLTIEINFARDGDGLLFNEFGMDRTVDIGRIGRTSWTGEELDSTVTEQGHHAFAELPDGTLAWTAVDVRDWYDPDLGHTVKVTGDRIVELAPGGEPTTVWSTWDALEPRKHGRWNDEFYPGMHDWTHANGLRWHEATDSWVVSLGNIDTVVQVSRAEGAAVRVMGADGMPVIEAPPFTFQHDAHLTEAGTLLLFATRPDQSSGAAEFTIDDEAGVLRQVWSHGYEDRIRAMSLGQALRYDDGNTLVNFGGAGLLREVTPDGDVVWEAHTDSGTWFAQVHPFDDFYHPLETSP